MTSAAPQILLITPILSVVIDGCGPLAPCLAIDRQAVMSGDLVRLSTVRAVAVWDCFVDAAMLDRLPSLELIANFGVGYDKIDVAAATARGIAVTHSPEVLTEEVADLTLGLLLMTVRRLGQAERFVRAGRWANGPFPLSPTTLRGRRVGVLGLGRIGLAVARRLVGFGVEIAYCNRRPIPEAPYPYFSDALGLAAAVDTLICLLPGGAATRHTINAEVLAALGPNGVLVNVGRGSTVDEAALAEALSTGVIAAAGLDVFEKQPLTGGPLVELDNVVLLPHVGSASLHTRTAMGRLVVDNIAAWLDGRPALTPTPESRAAGLTSSRATRSATD